MQKHVYWLSTGTLGGRPLPTPWYVSRLIHSSTKFIYRNAWAASRKPTVAFCRRATTHVFTQNSVYLMQKVLPIKCRPHNKTSRTSSHMALPEIDFCRISVFWVTAAVGSTASVIFAGNFFHDIGKSDKGNLSHSPTTQTSHRCRKVDAVLQ